MRTKIKILTVKKLILLLVGLNIAFFAVGYDTVMKNIYSIQADKIVNTHQDQSPSEEQDQPEFFLVAYNAIVPVIQIHMDHDLYFIFDIPLIEENEFEIIPEKINFINSYFQTPQIWS